jgi:photosystem II stability/assembly factor-like uncharacterized protein
MHTREPKPFRRFLVLAGAVMFFVSCMSSSLIAQEKERIELDDDTARVVVSPWESVKVETDAHFRGLHVVDDNVVWASGSKGTVIVSSDRGKTWRVRTVEGAEDLDFRDVHGFDDGAAVIISSGDVAKVFRTTNGGRTWKSCGKKEGAFFDALSFWDDRYGIIMSDPIDGRIWLARTKDGGESWKALPKENLPNTEAGEAGFAASGTNMCVVGTDTCFIGLGGTEENQFRDSSRILISRDRGKSWKFGGPVPLQRSPSSGIFSLCFTDELKGVAVGGDYLKPDEASSNYAVTTDGGKTWSTPSPRVPPSGYRSCVASWKKGREVKLVAVGTNGTDMSTDLGQKWVRVSNKGFNSVDFSDTGRTGWGVGQNGSVARWVLPK